MTKGTQLWPNARMRDFFLAHIRRETSLEDAAAARLADALLKSVNRMLVWDMPAADAPVPEAAKKTAPARTAPAQPSKATAQGSEGAAAFNPFLFSAMVVLAKTGREGLAKRLTEIKSAENLKAFADAQHLGIDRKLTKTDDLRKAILAATEQRLADRKAAAG